MSAVESGPRLKLSAQFGEFLRGFGPELRSLPVGVRCNREVPIVIARAEYNGGFYFIVRSGKNLADILSPRELQAAWLLQHGFSDKEIGRSCKLATETVREYLARARIKAGSLTRSALAAHPLDLEELVRVRPGFVVPQC